MVDITVQYFGCAKQFAATKEAPALTPRETTHQFFSAQKSCAGFALAYHTQIAPFTPKILPRLITRCLLIF